MTAKSGAGIPDLIKWLEKSQNGLFKTSDETLVTNLRHYEKLKEAADSLAAAGAALDAELPGDLLAEDLVFIDPAHDMAVECYRLLREDGLLAEEGTAAVNAFISVPAGEIDPACLTPDGKLTYEFKYGRNPGDDPCTRPVPFSRSNLDPENLARIRAMLPRSYSLIEPGL